MEPGPAVVWLRMRQPLVAGEPTSPLARVLVAADAGNGVSAALDYRRYLFINTELTVHLVREPAGEWVCLDAVTRGGPARRRAGRERPVRRAGRLGRAAQTLLVRPPIDVTWLDPPDRVGDRNRGAVSGARCERPFPHRPQYESTL